MNIKNMTPREVVCIRNENNNFFDCDKNSNMLEVGKTYTLRKMNVYNWYTEVELKEFPDILFNSVCFEEK